MERFLQPGSLEAARLICFLSWSVNPLSHRSIETFSWTASWVCPRTPPHDCLTVGASPFTEPKCLWSCAQAVPRNSAVRAARGDDCRPGNSVIYAPHANKHAYAIHTPGVLIVTEQHVFSARAMHLLRLFKVTKCCCSDALLLSAGSSMCWGGREGVLLGQEGLWVGSHPDISSPLAGFIRSAQEGGQVEELRLLPVLV